MTKIAVVSLGCNKNLVDSEMILGLLAKRGYEIVSDESLADIIIINTCAFIHDAKQESIDKIIEMGNLKSDNCKGIIVTGCLATRYEKEIKESLPEVDCIARINDYDKIIDFIDKKGLFVTNTDTFIVNKAILYDFQARYVNDDLKSFPKLQDNILDFGGKFSVDIRKYKLFGKHNIINLSFALTMADKVCDFKGDITNLIENLTSMPHRTEFVAEINGVKWINDSKATNVDSVFTALQSMEKPAILLIGGRDKKSDYKPLSDLINKNISKICYFGEAADLIKSQLSSLLHNVEEESYKSLKECVKTLAEKEKDITILLSPACTSFDEFKSYEDRGEKFRQYILEYVKEGK